MNRSLKISQAFSGAAESYDQHAFVQNFVAQKLARTILDQKKSSLGTVLEIGSGTGILSTHLVSHAEHYVLTDISFELLQKAREKVRGDSIIPIVVNGEHPCFSASFDVIVSNLVLHWFQDAKAALTGLAACLKPGGTLYLSALGNNTFHEWRTIHSVVDASCGVLDFISFGQLKDWLPLFGERHVEEDWVVTTPANTLQFLHGLKAIGASTPHSGHKPLPYGTFKKIMDLYDENPTTSFQVLYGIYQKPEKIREE
ncbi:MAG: methyltransferase domain-containing protein [Proteobacteria bacterium]|nr:methyltransferase domain-containing protein [Pseudomonadota bacterium]